MSKTAYVVGFAIIGGVIAPFASICLIVNLTMGMGESLAFMSVLPSGIIGIVIGAFFGNVYYIRKEAAQKKKVEEWQETENSGDGLTGFIRKIDNLKLNKTAEEYYNNG